MEYEHLLNQCSHKDETAIKELSKLYDEITDRSQDDASLIISDNCLHFLSDNLKSDDALPVITLIQKIISHPGNVIVKNLNSVHNLIVKEIDDSLQKSVESEDKTEQQLHFGRFLNLLVQFENEQVNSLPNIISKLRNLASLGYLKEIYYALIVRKDEFLLQEFVKDDIQQNSPLVWNPDADAMIDLIISSKKHWLLEMVDNCFKSITNNEDSFEIDSLIAKHLVNLSIIQLVNQQSDDSDLSSFLSNIDQLLQKTENGADEPVSLYISEIRREHKLLQFCITNSKKKSHFKWLEQILNQSALSFISQNCDISNIDSASLLEILQSNNDILHKLYQLPKNDTQWDINIFKSYLVLSSVIDLILRFQDNRSDILMINEEVEKIKRSYLTLTSYKDKIAILENIFTCLFLRTEHFCDNYTDIKPHFVKYGFVCNRMLVKKILFFLKNCLQEIRETAPSTCENFARLNKLVSESIWKYQLITTLKIGSSVKQSPYASIYDNMVDQSSDEELKADTFTKKKIRMKRRKSSIDSGTDPPKDTTPSPTQEKNIIFNEDFISLMLSPPSTLLSLCLENTDFSRANEIIDLYKLYDTQQAKEVKFIGNYLNMVMQIKQQFGRRSSHPIESLAEVSTLSITVISLVETFLSSNIQHRDDQTSELLSFHSELSIYSQKCFPLLVITDLAISTGLNKSITYGMMNIAEKKLQDVTNGESRKDRRERCNYVTFIKNMINLVYDLYSSPKKEYDDFGMCNILTCDKLPLKYKDFQQTNDFLDRATNLVNEITRSFELDIKLLTELVNLCNKNFMELGFKNVNDKLYLKHLLIYSKSIHEFLNLGNSSGEKQPHFLKLHVHEVISQLIVDDKVSLNDIESVCKVLGIDFIQKLVLDVCPPIECLRSRNSKNCNFIEILLDINDQVPLEEFPAIPIAVKKPMRNIMIHILIHNWVIGYLVKRIHSDNTDYILKESVDARTWFLDAYLSLDRFKNLKILYGNNSIVTALQTAHNTENLKSYLKYLLMKNEYDQCLSVLDSLPVYYSTLHPTLVDLKDEILLNMSRKSDLKDNYKYFLKISNREMQIKNLQDMFGTLQYWTSKGAKEVLNFIMTNIKCAGLKDGEEVKNECKVWLASIPVYEDIAKVHEYTDWTEVYKLSINNPESVLQLLIDENQYKLCLEWLKIHNLSNNVQNLVTINYLKQIIKSQDNFTQAELKNTLLALPVSDILSFLNQSINQITDIKLLNVCVDFLIANSEGPQKYQNIRIGVEILSNIDEKERQFFWEIVDKPLIIIEQYLLNARFDKLSRVLSKIRPLLKHDQCGDNLFFNINLVNTCTISHNSVDALLRIYATKALDLRSSKVNRELQISKKADELALQSIDSINLIGQVEEFVMPETAPTRDMWVPNDFSDSCMCCKTTTFSIYIRKHHCRRCGRIVCYYCSRNKLTIDNLYDGIKVRVCNFCYTQTTTKAISSEPKKTVTSFNSATSVQSEHLSMEWCLTADIMHNIEIRREFAYEFSPNVTLFLTIMKMHTVNFDYQRFLNEKSVDLLKSVKELGDNKADICELLKMRKSLLVGHSVLYYESATASTAFSNTAIAETERQLAATDTLMLLASHGYHSLILTQELSEEKTTLTMLKRAYANSIRKLLEAEKWDLALEISTKCGFPRNDILATWGKACLRAGCFDSARQKFSFCFNKTGNSPSAGNDSLNSSTVNIQQDINKSKSIPLLQEIVSILENTSYVVNAQIIKRTNSIKSGHEKIPQIVKTNKKIEVEEPAVNIIHSLSSIQKIRTGDYSDFTTSHLYSKKTILGALTKKSSSQNEKYESKLLIDKYFYDECLYYLTTYGCHSLMIEFYLKYDNLKDALFYSFKNDVDKEVFADYLFLNCLKLGKINQLLAAMSEMDPNWHRWIDYINYSCRSLESKGNLEGLLTVQVGVKDYVRAAITCANLYSRPTVAPHAMALHKRSEYLFQAQAHLQHVPRRLSELSTAESSLRSLQLKMDGTSITKHINTLRCQIEIASYLTKCEEEGNLLDDMMTKILIPSSDSDNPKNECFLPTLFSNHSRKIQLAAIIILCSSNVSEGFSLSSRIIKEQNLDPTKVFSIVVRCLVSTWRYEDVAKVCELIVNEKQPDSRKVCDTIVEMSIGAIVRKCDENKQLFDELAEMLIEKVENVEVKISCYIECRMLQMAYTLAVKNSRLGDLRRVMREAERLGQTQVKNACAKKLAPKARIR